MENNIEEHAYGINNTKNVLIGLLIGGMAGAAAMLLFTPQSGKRTRAQIHQIQQKSIQLRDRTTNNIINQAADGDGFGQDEAAQLLSISPGASASKPVSAMIRSSALAVVAPSNWSRSGSQSAATSG
ncbi:MAG: YtxH domain-containing protein [Chloroflexi bacterium]|nr:YtxH domain-containing protein [Chloroflexota bacterium]